MFILCSYYGNLLQEEVKQLMKAAEDGDITALKDLIVEKKLDVNTKGPWYPWVSY